MEMIICVIALFFVIYGLTFSLKQRKKNNKDMAENLAKIFSDNDDKTNNELNFIAECPSCGNHMNLEGNIFICSSCGYTVKKDKIQFFKMSIESVSGCAPYYTLITGTIINGTLSDNDNIYINRQIYKIRQIQPLNSLKTINQAKKGMKIRVSIENPHNDIIPVGEFITKYEGE